MFWIYFGLYTIFLFIIWGFFIVVRLHAMKFKNFSHNIEKMTLLLMIFLIIFSIIGYVAIFIGSDSGNTPSYIDVNSNNNYSEIDY